MKEKKQQSLVSIILIFALGIYGIIHTYTTGDLSMLYYKVEMAVFVLMIVAQIIEIIRTRKAKNNQ